MSTMEQTPVWASREYWGGACVDAPGTFDTPKRPAEPFNSAQDAAAYVLATALEGVLEGNYEQRPATTGGGFHPQAAELEDGAVLLLERERLTRMKYQTGWAKHREDELGDLPEDIADFAEYWRRHHDSPSLFGPVEKKTFGREGQELSYQRSLQWGLLVPHLGGQAVFTWDPEDFDHGFFVHEGVVRFQPERRDMSLLPAPFYLGRAEATRKGRKNVVIPRSIERTTGVQLIEAEGTANYREALENSDTLSTIEFRLSGQALALASITELMTASYLSSQA